MLSIRPRAFQFSAAHHLPNMPEGHKCRRMHGHTYTVRVEVTGPLVDGMLPDYAVIEAIVREVASELDHRTLNEIDGLEKPTTEILTQWLADRIAPRIRESLASLTGLVVDEGGHECVWRP